jgi:hypothetical protein
MQEMSLDVKGDRADTVPMTSPASLHLLHAGPVDAGTLTRLAALDETEPLTGEVLLAIADGEAVAAMSVDDGRVAADPFARTHEAVALLRMRARQERRRSGTARRFGSGRLGLAA